MDEVAVSVVIPAYNERMRLPPTLEKVEPYLRERFATWEIIVADDGSTDGSIEEFEKRFPNVTFLRAPRNQGKGAAVRRGMLASRGALALFTDADLSTPIDELTPMIEALKAGSYDVVIASRDLPDSKLDLRQPWYRELAGKTFNLMVRVVSGLPFRDTQCGFKLFTRAAGQAIFSRAMNNGFAFDVEALVVAKALGLKTLEAPVRWVDAEGSKVKLIRDAPRMLRDIVTFRWRSIQGVYGDGRNAAPRS